MSTLTTLIDSKSGQFVANSEHNRALAKDLRVQIANAALGGGEKSRERHASRGKLLPRDRVHCLLDPGSPFLELSALAANGMYGNDAPGAGVVAGIGRVSGSLARSARVRDLRLMPTSWRGGCVWRVTC
jgi:3-methylcrotonyl-CoA carboxylase beta subunit